MIADAVVIGAGPAGIGAAIGFGPGAVLLERGQDVAGLCGTMDIDGAVFDLGGHSFHTPHPDVRALVFNALAMEEQRRNAWCWHDGEWIPYPFQQNLAALADPQLRAACQTGAAASDDARGATDFDAYLDRRFGKPVADIFMRPYNRKLWGHDLTRLTVDWTRERVAGPAAIAVDAAGSAGCRTPLQATSTVAYPARGGFAEIFKALALHVPDLRLGQSVTRIDPIRRRLTTERGDTIAWRSIVATIPLPALLAMTDGVPHRIAAAVAQLQAIPIDLAMVVLEGRGPLDRQRVYCAGPQMPGHKVVLNNTSSPWLRQQPRHGIQVEVAGHGPAPPGDLAGRVIAGLIRLGLIGGSAEVRRIEVRRLELGYPIPTHARAAIVAQARSWLDSHGIRLAGRFAEWAYINSDEALRRGLRTGQALRSDAGDAAA